MSVAEVMKKAMELSKSQLNNYKDVAYWDGKPYTDYKGVSMSKRPSKSTEKSLVEQKVEFLKRRKEELSNYDSVPKFKIALTESELIYMICHCQGQLDKMEFFIDSDDVVDSRKFYKLLKTSLEKQL